MYSLRYWLLCLAVLNVGTGWALEYLSDGELENMDGYTSSSLVKEVDDEGDLRFRRVDSFKCRYDQSEDNEDARLHCEGAFDNIHDQMLATTFERYLEQALDLMRNDPVFDTPGDHLQEIDKYVRLEGFDYNHQMCDIMPDKMGVVRFEGISFTGKDGGDFRFGKIRGYIEETYDENTGAHNRSIVTETGTEGIIGVRAIKVGMDVETARYAKSLGAVYIDLGDSTMRISLNEGSRW